MTRRWPGLENLDPEHLTPRELIEFVKAGIDVEAWIYGLDREDTAPAVRIVINPRLLPAGAELPANLED